MSVESMVLSRAALIFGTTEEKIKETATAKRGPASDARSAVILVLRNDAERSHEEIAHLLGYADFGCARQAYYAARNKRLRLPAFSDLVERLSTEMEPIINLEQT